jgi:peptide/nickel transport system substrate-binding protein
MFIGNSNISTASKPTFNAALHNQVGDYAGQGGTLKLGSMRLCDSFDPAASFDLWCGVIFRTYVRNVVSYAGKAGNDGFVIVPDLARSKPKSSDDYIHWTINLRKNIRWDDGTELTSEDVKYTIARLFDPSIVGTVSNDTLCLFSECSDGTPDYLGPIIDKEKDLTSVALPDKYSLAITLRAPYARLGEILASPQFGIVEKARDEKLRSNGKTYASKPASSGPYIVDIKDGSVTFTRNPKWVQETDSVRVPKAAAIEWSTFQTAEQADDAVIKHVVDLRVDGGLSGIERSKIFADPQHRNLIDQTNSGAVSYLTLISTFKPFDNKNCREAIAYALNKADLVNVQGGSEIAQVATSMISPTIPGGDKSINPFPVGKDNQGDLDKARVKLTKCGYPDGFEVRMAYVNLGSGKSTYESIQKSLSRVGIVVDPIPYESFADYFSSGIGSPENVINNDIGMLVSSWIPEAGSSSSYWSPIADGRAIKLRGNLNYAGVNNEDINNKIDDLEGTRANLSRINNQIDKLIMNEVVYIPYLRNASLLYRNTNLTNVYVHRALYGEYDIVNIGLTLQGN